ncbi:MAG TPA: GTPase, partial [Haliangiales bacterium]|nr:GTPase [Haliangiales bacterium]
MIPTDVVGAELAAFLCECSVDVGRQVGILVDRRGTIEHVVVGDASKLMLPDVGRLRAARGRFRGLRLVHTHLRGESLTQDDLTDLALLRLDLVAAIDVQRGGRPGLVHMAHLVPSAPAVKDPWIQLPPRPAHALDLDFAELIRSLEDEFARTTDRVAPTDRGKDRALVVHVAFGRRADSDGRIAELRELARSAGVKVLEVVEQRRAEPDPKYLLGHGKLSDVVVRAMQLGAELLIFDPDLSPGQSRAISDFTDLKVIDRTMLILDIFAQRAQSRDGKLQVELAQLKYTLPRLVEKNTMMSRLTGGIGGRGPGETKLEINRRRAVRRKRRGERDALVASIIGYTNAGKSTLFNRLTGAEVFVKDLLFATLDPTMRGRTMPSGRKAIFSDTVGFISDLPTTLVAAFRATLEEVIGADVVMHVRDISHPDTDGQAESVHAVLRELGLGDKVERGLFEVLNKIDRLDAAARERILNQAAQSNAPRIAVSALTGEG